MKNTKSFLGLAALLPVIIALAGTPLFAQANPSGSLYVVFPGFGANLGTVSTELAVQNAAAFTNAAQLLLENPRYRLLVDGHANPLLGTDAEERDTLKPLSQQRAQAVADFLVTYYGIARARLIIVASGGSAPAAQAASDPKLNRAVTLTLVP
jgi:outer membrane protein OmpA-like peptidoglycan-associated protein